MLLVGIFRFVYVTKIEYDYKFSNYCRYEKSYSYSNLEISIVGETINNKKPICVLLERCALHCPQQFKKNSKTE